MDYNIKQDEGTKQNFFEEYNLKKDYFMTFRMDQIILPVALKLRDEYKSNENFEQNIKQNIKQNSEQNNKQN